MTDYYSIILEYKEDKKLGYTELGRIIGKSADAFRMAMKRKSLSELEIEKLLGHIANSEQETEQEAQHIYVNEPTSYIKNKNGLLYEELPNGKFLVEVPKVPYNAYASFIEVFGDEYAVKEMFGTKTFTVDHPGKGSYLCFITKNESMNGGGINDTPSEAEVLGRELQRHHWKDGFRESIYGWIIISHDGMFHKDIVGPDNVGNITCKSRNTSPEFPDFTINLNNVHSIWKVIKRTF